MPVGRRRAVLVVGSVLAIGLPLHANAMAPHLTCGPKLVGSWETVPVRPFQPVAGIASQDTVTAYAVDTERPWELAATNGVRVQVSHTDGCDWENAFALDPSPQATPPGAASTIVSVAELQGTTLAAIQVGSGLTSAPYIARSVNGTWQVTNSGLPSVGVPRLLRAGADGHTVYLTVSPTATGGSDNGATNPAPLPSAGGIGTPLSQPTGLLYQSTDGGATWSLQTSPPDLPGGGAGFSDLEVDPADANWIEGIANGSLKYSTDGGQTFGTIPGNDWTAVTPMYPGTFAAFTSQGTGIVSVGATRIQLPFHAPKGVTSAGFRAGDTALMVEAGGSLYRVNVFGKTSITPSASPARPRPGSLRGDVGPQASFHALAGHSLLRYVDPPPTGLKVTVPPAIGDTTVTPPVPGSVQPALTKVSLLTGQSETEDFALKLPRNPTPLDLFFLIDISSTMGDYLANLKTEMHKVVDQLRAEKVDLRVGVGTIGAGPAPGEGPYPDVYAGPPSVDTQTGQTTPAPPYQKPQVYRLIRRIGKTDASLTAAINAVQLETEPTYGSVNCGDFHEGQLLALEQMITGSGVHGEHDLPNTYSEALPGQDAHFRTNPDVRRMVVIASNESFDAPFGTPTQPGSTCQQPIPDFHRTIGILKAAHVGVFGVTAGSTDSEPDMDTLASGTNTVAPSGGVSCGGDPQVVIPAGAPLVCDQDGDFGAIIAHVLSSLTDRQDIHLQPRTVTPVLAGLDGRLLRGLNVKQANVVDFSARISCRGVAPGSYVQDVDATLRGFTVGTTRLEVNCIAPLAAVPPIALIPAPAVRPALPAPFPAPAPLPAAQPQPPAQANPNANPLTVGVTQEQQEAQLALAQQDAVEEPVETGEQLAMVDRRKRQEVQAFGLLMFAMTVCGGLGLARLRTRPELAVRRAR